MTQDPRIDRMEGVLERIIADQAEYRQDMRQMRTGFQSETQQMRNDSRQEAQEIRSEIRSRFNTLLIINIALWVTTIGTLVGFFSNGS